MRHADPVTLDHIIELRKRIAELERQLDNVLAWIKPLQRENDRLIAEVKRTLRFSLRSSLAGVPDLVVPVVGVVGVAG